MLVKVRNRRSINYGHIGRPNAGDAGKVGVTFGGDFFFFPEQDLELIPEEENGIVEIIPFHRLPENCSIYDVRDMRGKNLSALGLTVCRSEEAKAFIVRKIA